MAKKIQKNKKSNSDSVKPVEIYEHKGTTRLNNPQVGLVNTKTEKPDSKKEYKFDPHLTPNLNWAGKVEKEIFVVPTVSLHVHEKIDPRTVIEAVKKTPEKIWEQLNLFNKPINKLSFIKEIEFYKHHKDWSNRLISGDSLIVANSLIEKESMGGKVQTIFFDPPYGIKYGSNFQPFVNQKEVADKSDEDLASEPEIIKAFRDTWELGIHSYLSYLRDRLIVFRELLADSGSIFFQISDENLHFARNLLDEVFGSENFIAIIPFRKKTMPFGTKFIEQMADFIIWYGKKKRDTNGKSITKYRPLFRTFNAEGDFHYCWYQMPDGQKFKMSKKEIDNHALLPEGARVYRLKSLEPSGKMDSGMFSYEFEGRTFPPPKNGYATPPAGMKQLELANRLQVEGNRLTFIMYADENSVSSLTAPWFDTVGADNKVYVVQTNTEVVKRCILMTSDPGDLVFDPTCGSGTAAYVSEEWGRRWITCDTSRVAISLTKQRLLTASYDYFQFAREDDGVSSGFKYKTAGSVTVGSLANSEPVASDILYDQPIIDTKKVRITGPFTVEAVPAPVVKEVGSEPIANSLNGPSDWIQELRKSGIRTKNNKMIKLSSLEVLPGTKWIHASGFTDEEKPQRVVISFGPDFAPLEQRQVELAALEVEKLKPSPTIIVFAAFQFDPEAAKDIDQIEWTGVSVLKVQMNTDLFTEDLKKKRSSSESFWLVGQPDITINHIKSGSDKGKLTVSVNGFDYYNPKTGSVDSGGSDQIAMWLLDTDYDGRSLLPRQIFFPMSGPKDGWSKLAKTLKNEIDEDLIEAYRGTNSLPFVIGENKKIAIKIIDDRGIESLIVQDIEI